MKKRIGILWMVAVAICGMALSANAAPMTCPLMKVSLIAADAAVGGNIWLKNESGAACGNIAAGASQFFIFNPAEADKLLAVGLTAVSLGKNVWVAAEGDTVGSVVNVIAIQNM